MLVNYNLEGLGLDIEKIRMNQYKNRSTSSSSSLFALIVCERSAIEAWFDDGNGADP